MGDVNPAEYEVYVCSQWEKDRFPKNNAKQFKNKINDSLKGEGVIGVFVKIEKIIICGVYENQFLICCEGLPQSNIHVGTESVMGVCVAPVKRTFVGREAGGHIRTYRFHENNGGYYPLAVRHVDNWNITLVPWGCKSKDLCKNINYCILHIKVKPILTRRMSIIHKSLYVKFENKGGRYLQSGKLNQPLIIKEGQKVSLTGGLIRGVPNLAKGHNMMLLKVNKNIDALDCVEKLHANTFEHWGDLPLVNDILDINVEVKESWYGTMKDLVSEMNEAMENVKTSASGERINIYVPKPVAVAGREKECQMLSFTMNHQNKIVVNNNSVHQIQIIMSKNMSKITGLSKSILLSGGGIPLYSQSNTIELAQKSISSKSVGHYGRFTAVSPPPFYMLSSPLAKTGYLGRGASRVLSFLECGDQFDDEGKVQIISYGGGDNFVSAQPGRYDNLECEILNGSEGMSLQVGMIIKSDE